MEKEEKYSLKLSIIVPVFNMADNDKLKWCLDSLVNQSISYSYEIIAVDDCSTDDSPLILKKYADKYVDRFVALFSKKNHHQGGAKNIGLAFAKGEWISFIDADDWVTPDYYDTMIKKAEETGADMVGCDYQMTMHHNLEPGKYVKNNFETQSGILDKDKYKLLILDPGSLAVKIFRREIILDGYEKCTQSKMDRFDELARIKVFPEDIFYEDNAVVNTWMLRSRHFEYIPKANYYYYQHTDSTVHTISSKNMQDRMTAGRIILDEARRWKYLEEYYPEIEYKYTVLFYINTLFSVMPKESRFPDCYRFTKALGREMKETFPDFQENPYYQERTNPEEKKLIAMQMKSHALFYLYYRALWTYRNWKKKRK